jgi:hypothetical protein
MGDSSTLAPNQLHSKMVSISSEFGSMFLGDSFATIPKFNCLEPSFILLGTSKSPVLDGLDKIFRIF